MLDDIGCVTDHARDQHLAVRQLHRFPYTPFVLVTWVCHFQRIATYVHPQDEIGNVLQWDIVGVRSIPASPADMVATSFGSDATQRMIEGIDAERCPSAVILQA